MNSQNITIIIHPEKISDYPLREKAERNHESTIVRKFKYISGDFEPWISLSLLIGEASCGALKGSYSIRLNDMDFSVKSQTCWISSNSFNLCLFSALVFLSFCCIIFFHRCIAPKFC